METGQPFCLVSCLQVYRVKPKRFIFGLQRLIFRNITNPAALGCQCRNGQGAAPISLE